MVRILIVLSKKGKLIRTEQVSEDVKIPDVGGLLRFETSNEAAVVLEKKTEIFNNNPRELVYLEMNE